MAHIAWSEPGLRLLRAWAATINSASMAATAVAATTTCAFDMGRLSPELLGHMFASLDTRTATMVVPRVCRLWKEVCAGVAVLEEFELAWACTKLLNLAGADAWQGASPGRSG